jgi:ABC-2 type transport system permease protein
MQIIDGFVISFSTYYQSSELALLYTSPVNRISLFFSRLFETHLKTSWMIIIFGMPLLVSLGMQFHAGTTYYVYSFMALIAFSIIPVNIGIGIAIILSGIFYLKRLKKFMFAAGFIACIGIIILLRVFQPERFVNPELFANLKIFLSELNTPSFILLPNRWISESLFNLLDNNYKEMLIFTSLLFLTAYITIYLLVLIFKRYHYRGWSILQGGDTGLKRKRRIILNISGLWKMIVSSRPVQQFLPFFDSQRGALLIKDFLYQFHDVKNIQQNLILFALIIIYLFSVAALPLNWEGYHVKLKYIVSFFNLGLILVIIASLCSKLVYPAIVSEGSYLWIIKTSPITSEKYIWSKFIFLFIPVITLGQSLTVFSSFFVDIKGTIFVLNILTTTVLCFSLVGLAIAFSMTDLRDATKGEAGEEVKTGNTFYMMLSVFFILFTLALEAIPIYLYFLKETVKIEFTQKAWLIIGGIIFVLLFVNILTTLVSMRLSIKRFYHIQLG